MVVVVDGTVGVELGTLVLGLVVATDFDGLPPPEQPARISAPAATMTGISDLACLWKRIRIDARYLPGGFGGRGAYLDPAQSSEALRCDVRA